VFEEKPEPLASGDFRFWPIATFRCDAELGRNRGGADIEHAAPMNTHLTRCDGGTPFSRYACPTESWQQAGRQIHL
jgi:hypothetical protein